MWRIILTTTLNSPRDITIPDVLDKWYDGSDHSLSAEESFATDLYFYDVPDEMEKEFVKFAEKYHLKMKIDQENMWK
jgi:hypothetical protein